MFGKSGKPASPRKLPNRGFNSRLTLEALEDRLVPATLPLHFLEHVAQITAELGITSITTRPTPQREVIGSVFLQNPDSGRDHISIDPDSQETGEIDWNLNPTDLGEADPDETEPGLAIPTDEDPPVNPAEPGIAPIQGIGIINPLAPGLPSVSGPNPGLGSNPVNNNPAVGALPGGGINPGNNNPGAGINPGNNNPGGGINPGNNNPGAGVNPGNNNPGGGVNPGNNNPGGGVNPGNNNPGGWAGLPGGGQFPGISNPVVFFPISGINPVNPATGSPYWPNPGPLPGLGFPISGVGPGVNPLIPGNGNPGSSNPAGGTGIDPGNGGSISTPMGVLKVNGIDPDTGASNSDRVTRAKSPTVYGTAPANSVITILSQGQSIGSGMADASGKFRAPIALALADGEHVFQVTCSQASSVPLQFTIDTQAPTLTIDATQWVPEKGNFLVKVSANFSKESVGNIMLDVDLNQNGAFEDAELSYRTGSPGDIFQLNELKGYGNFTMRARAEDLAGNVGSATSQSFVDRNAGWVGDDYLRNLAQPVFAALGQTGKWDGRTVIMDSNWQPNDPKLLESILISTRTGLASEFPAFLKTLENLGMTQITANASDGLVEGQLPLYQVLRLPVTPAFSTASSIAMVSHVGSVQNEGVPVMKVPQFMAQTGYTGFGMKIGVLSDSANANGSVTTAQASGDLPPDVQILTDFPQGSDEGCAMLEVAYDVAPGASLAFTSAWLGAQGFADGIKALSDIGCQVIVDDVTHFNSPIYNEGRIALSIDDVVFNDGRFYCGAAGNQANNGFRGIWNSSTATIGTGAGTVTGTFMDFGGSPYQNVNITSKSSLTFTIKWDSAYLEGGSSLANFQVGNSVFAYLVDLTTNTVVASGTADNLTTDMAYQRIDYTNSGTTTNFGLAYQLVTGNAPTRLGWTAYGAGEGANSLFPNGGGGPSISNTALAKGSVAVGAVSWQTPTVAEDFTSMGGPLEFLFDAAGNRLTTPYTFFKPQISAPDGISTTLPSGGLNPFYGTSCAAPQVAGVAALVWGNQPNLTRDQLTFHLYATAMDVASPGNDDLTGIGLVQAYPVPSGAFGSGDISDNSLSAWHLGTIGNSQLISPYLDISNHTGLPDYDWFTLRAGQAGRLNLRMLQGTTGSLEVRFFTLDGNLSLIQRAASTKPGQMLRTISMDVAANQLVYIEIKGYNSSYGVTDEALYQMTLSVS